MWMHRSKDNVSSQVATTVVQGQELGMDGNSKSRQWRNSDPPNKATPPQARKKQGTKKCKAYVPLLIICLVSLMAVENITNLQKKNQTRQKLGQSQISRSAGISRMDCKKHQSKMMNIYTGSNDVLYWLYNSQQISKGKTGIYL